MEKINQNPGLQHFQYFNFLLQEMDLVLEENFLDLVRETPSLVVTCFFQSYVRCCSAAFFSGESLHGMITFGVVFIAILLVLSYNFLLEED